MKGEPKVLPLHPRWKQAVFDFLADKFQDGDIVTHDWLETHLGFDRLADDAVLTAQEHKERSFRWLQHIEAFKAELLEGHRVLLVSVHGEGYRVAPPAEQTALAMTKFASEVKMSFRRAGSRIKHIRFEALTDDQRKENVDAVAKLSMLRGMTKQIR